MGVDVSVRDMAEIRHFAASVQKFTAKNGADCYSKNGDAVTVPTWQS